MKILIAICFINIILFLLEVVPAQPLIIAHRGAMGYAPENTISAFKMAIDLGANALELDLRQTKDGILVALHDATVNKTTNGKGDVNNFNFKDLQKLDAGSWFDKKFSCEKIPSLQEVVDVLNDSIILIIELKEGNETYPGIEERVVKLVIENEIESRIILKFFDPNVLRRLREIDSNIPLCYVYALRIPWLGMIIDRGVTFGSIYNIDAEYLQPHRFFLSESFVADAQSKGFKIISWGVNSSEAIIESLDYDVDGIETDYPDLVLEIIKSR